MLQQKKFDHAIAVEQCRLLYQQGLFVVYVGMAVAMLTAAVLQEVIAPDLLIVWLTLFSVVGVLRVIANWRFMRLKDEDFHPRYWNNIYIVGTLASGLMWGVPGAMYDPSWPPYAQVALFIIYAGLIAGAYNSYAVVLPAFVLFMVPLAMPLFWQLLSRESDNGDFLAFSFFLYLLVMLRSAWLYSRFLRQNSETSIANRTLADKVNEQSGILEKLNRELKQQNQLKEYVLEGASLGYWDWYPKTHEHYVSHRWLEMLGLDASDLDNHEKDWNDRIHPDDRHYAMLVIKQAIEEKTSYSVEFRMRHREGHYVWICGSGAVVEYEEDGSAKRLSGIHQEITERKCIEEEFERQRLYMQTLYDLNPNIIIVSNGRNVIDANRAFFELFSDYVEIDAFKAEHRCICNLFEHVDGGHHLYPGDEEWVKAVSSDRSKQALLKLNGRSYNFDITAREITFRDAPIYIVTLTDTTDRYELQQKFRTMAVVDDLTGIHNRRYFNEMIGKLHAGAQRHRGTLGFMMIDIDNFKRYNDNYGHDQGDSTLKQVAQIINGMHIRKSDVVCRLGGEEFGIMMTDVEPEKCFEHARHICREVKAAQIPHRFNQDYGVVTISVGVAYIDFAHESKSIDAVYKEADEALYRSKEAGRNRATFHECCNDVSVTNPEKELRCGTAEPSEEHDSRCQTVL
jgi:diguanylate cyclase (GGDEF)-like protein/PAS domain S-box-containing protein